MKKRCDPSVLLQHKQVFCWPLAVTPQSFHRTAVVLEQRGLVQRLRKADNQKSFYLTLTTKGKRLNEQAVTLLKAEQDKLKSQFTAQELDELYTLLVEGRN